MNQPQHTHETDQPVRIGVVSFINTLPLIDGLENLADIELVRTVPSLLLPLLLSGEAEIALCSSIDYQRSSQPLVLIPAGQLGCAGSTLTVRLYSQTPLRQIEQVHCDSDSHTSIALMQILLAECYGIQPTLVEYDAREHVAENRPLEWPQAMLLIGDKVVTDSPPAVRYPHQLDLGKAWHDLTGLPFVFAMWMARGDSDPHRVQVAAAVLDRQRLHNRDRIDRIICNKVTKRNWPIDLAGQYLKQRIRYEVTDENMAGLELFYSKAREHRLITDVRPIEVLDMTAPMLSRST